MTEYEFHPEAKCADALGNPCDERTIGRLQRRHIKIDLIKCIGKESNSLENVGEGMVHSEQNVYTEYADPQAYRMDYQDSACPEERKAKDVGEACGKKPSRREIIELRASSTSAQTSDQKTMRPLKLITQMVFTLGFRAGSITSCITGVIARF